MPDIETIQKRLQSPIPELMGVPLVELSFERALGELEVRPGLRTTGGIIHDGACMAFADAPGGVGTQTQLVRNART